MLPLTVLMLLVFAFSHKRCDGGGKDTVCKSGRLVLHFVAVPDVYFLTFFVTRPNGDAETRHVAPQHVRPSDESTRAAVPAAGRNPRLRTLNERRSKPDSLNESAWPARWGTGPVARVKGQT